MPHLVADQSEIIPDEPYIAPEYGGGLGEGWFTTGTVGWEDLGTFIDFTMGSGENWRREAAKWEGHELPSLDSTTILDTTLALPPSIDRRDQAQVQEWLLDEFPEITVLPVVPDWALCAGGDVAACNRVLAESTVWGATGDDTFEPTPDDPDFDPGGAWVDGSWVADTAANDDDWIDDVIDTVVDVIDDVVDVLDDIWPDDPFVNVLDDDVFDGPEQQPPPAEPEIPMAGHTVQIPPPPQNCEGVYVFKKHCGEWRWVKQSKRRRSQLVSRSDLRGLAALKGVLGTGKAFEVWIATHS